MHFGATVSGADFPEAFEDRPAQLTRCGRNLRSQCGRKLRWSNSFRAYCNNATQGRQKWTVSRRYGASCDSTQYRALTLLYVRFGSNLRRLAMAVLMLELFKESSLVDSELLLRNVAAFITQSAFQGHFVRKADTSGAFEQAREELKRAGAQDD